MAKKLFSIQKGMRITQDGSTDFYQLFGSGEPGADSGEQDEAPLGSVYFRSDPPFGIYLKKNLDNLTSDWQPFGPASIKETITLTQQQIDDGKIKLASEPNDVKSVRFIPKDGLEQNYGDDFTVVGDEVLFQGLGLDGFLDVGEVVYIYYTTF